MFDKRMLFGAVCTALTSGALWAAWPAAAQADTFHGPMPGILSPSSDHAVFFVVLGLLVTVFVAAGIIGLWVLARPLPDDLPSDWSDDW
jgi:hypothetical protein